MSTLKVTVITIVVAVFTWNAAGHIVRVFGHTAYQGWML